MNIGQKIKQLRESSSMTQEELATKINDTLDNIIKYESNEIEPSLDKKLAITTLFGIPLDDLSFNIGKTKTYVRTEESNVENALDVQTDVEVVESVVLEEIPFASSTTIYNEEVFNQLFQKEYKKYFIQAIIFGVGYVLSGFVVLQMMPILAIMLFLFGGSSLLRLLFTYLNYRKSKQAWLLEHNGIVKEYYYYRDYLTVSTKNENGFDNDIVKYFYKDFIRVLEFEEYMVAVYNGLEQKLLVINKNDFSTGSFVSVKPSFEKDNLNYIDLSLRTDKKNTEYPILNVILWILAIASLFSITIVNLIVMQFTKDLTLGNQMLVYGLAMILPIASVVIGQISKRVYNKPSKKNTIIGIVILVCCGLFMLSTITTHKEAVKNNDDELVFQIEEIADVNIPDYYYTVYKVTDKGNVVTSEYEYDVNVMQILYFVKEKEVEQLHSDMKNTANWITVTDENKSQLTFTLSDDVLNSTLYYGFQLNNNVSKYMIYNLTDKTFNDENIQVGKEYITMYYYGDTNSMLIVEYNCKAI